ncbi:uncharacterized protein [Dipodomys merriami]|uniref:uncharacterized protein n=1 Tax=Dipodomys merriami TaxID=94247 RepID=UPI003855B067
MSDATQSVSQPEAPWPSPAPTGPAYVAHVKVSLTDEESKVESAKYLPKQLAPEHKRSPLETPPRWWDSVVRICHHVELSLKGSLMLFCVSGLGGRGNGDKTLFLPGTCLRVATSRCTSAAAWPLQPDANDVEDASDPLLAYKKLSAAKPPLGSRGGAQQVIARGVPREISTMKTQSCFRSPVPRLQVEAATPPFSPTVPACASQPSLAYITRPGSLAPERP